MGPLENRIRRLEDELAAARRAIIGLMPDDVETLLLSYINVETREDSWRWEREAADKIIKRAKPFDDGFERRTHCPLCRRSSSAPYGEGFTFPEGLRRHLTGFGNTRQCDVMGAAFDMARDRWEAMFGATEREKWSAAQAEKLRRKKAGSELLYLIAPDMEPELLDERSLFVKARDKEGMAWVEIRLKELGFQIEQEGRVKRYVLERNGYAAYADPRAAGRIDFAIFKNPLPTPKRTRRPRLRFVPSFHILDSWKNDIRGKFDARLADAVRKAKQGNF